jgi:hypothetical protein
LSLRSIKQKFSYGIISSSSKFYGFCFSYLAKIQIKYILSRHDVNSKILESILKKLIFFLNKNISKIKNTAVKRVVEQLSKSGNKLYLHYYLDALFDRDPSISRDFHTMQVVLYAEYERDKLLSFLQNSQYIILAQAQKELQ